MNGTGQIVDHWRRITGELHPETGAPERWKDGPAPHFLHAFRPDGDRLPDLFAGMPEMAPVLDRLRVIFARAGQETGHLYFIVSRPRPVDDAGIERLVRTWLGNVASLAEKLGLSIDDDVARFLTSDGMSVVIAERPGPGEDHRAPHRVQSIIYEAVTSFGSSMTFASPAARLLEDPLYMLACSYELAFWVLSPLSPEARSDPFAPAAALWEAGVSLDFEGDGSTIRAVATR